jgi:ankyrin repeat protein
MSKLIEALKRDDVRLVEIRTFLNIGDDPNAKDEYGETCLNLAILSKSPDKIAIIDLLIERKVDICACGYINNTALCTAVKIGSLEILTKFNTLSKGKMLNTANSKFNTPLHLAAKSTSLEIVKYLLDNGAAVSMDLFNHAGYLPFHLSAKSMNLEIVKLLLKFISVNTLNRHGDHIFHCAIKKNNLGLVNHLLKTEAIDAINISNREGMTPLQYSVIFATPEMTKFLLDRGAKMSLNIRSHKGESPLSLAARYGELDHMKTLLDAGASLRDYEKEGDVPPLFAVVDYFNDLCQAKHLRHGRENFDPKLLIVLLRAEADINAKLYGENILHRLVSNTNSNKLNKSLLILIMDNCFDIDYSSLNRQGKTAAELASYDKTRDLILDAASKVGERRKMHGSFIESGLLIGIEDEDHAFDGGGVGAAAGAGTGAGGDVSIGADEVRLALPVTRAGDNIYTHRLSNDSIRFYRDSKCSPT